MSLKERVYSVLIVSAAERFNRAISPLLSESKYSPVCIVSDTGAAKRAIAERDFDFAIVNSPLPDGGGRRLAVDLCLSTSTVVLLFAGAEIYEEVCDEVAPHGVFTLQKPTSRSTFATALEWMGSARERLRRTDKKAISIEEKMEEIRLVNRAKWLLINELKIDEPAAHRYIEKQAMDRGVRKRQVAEEIVRAYRQATP